MSRQKASLIPLAKITVALAAAFGVGLACVVLGSIFAAPDPCLANCEKFDFGPVAGAGLALMFFSAIGLLITLVVFVSAKMFESLSFEREGSETIRLFDAEVEKKPKI